MNIKIHWTQLTFTLPSRVIVDAFTVDREFFQRFQHELEGMPDAYAWVTPESAQNYVELCRLEEEIAELVIQIRTAPPGEDADAKNARMDHGAGLVKLRNDYTAQIKQHTQALTVWADKVDWSGFQRLEERAAFRARVHEHVMKNVGLGGPDLVDEQIPSLVEFLIKTVRAVDDVLDADERDPKRYGLGTKGEESS